MNKSISSNEMTSLMLRAGLMLVFLYAGISSLMHPLEWVGFLPSFMTKLVSATVLIKLFAVYELLLVIWLLSGRFIKYCALLMAVTLFGIVLTNTGQLITTFRDVGLAFMSLALYFNSKG